MMKGMRRFVALALVCIGVAGCGPQTTSPAGDSPAAASQQVFKWKLITTWPKNLPGLGTARCS